MTIPISINVGLMRGTKSVFLIIARIKIKLLEIPKEYAASSISPNGEKSKIVSGGMDDSSGAATIMDAKANPVDQAEKRPHAIPSPGINMGNAIVVLCANIPNASMSETSFSNSAMKISASSSLTKDIEPI